MSKYQKIFLNFGLIAKKFIKSFKDDWYKIPNLLTLSRLIFCPLPALMLVYGPRTNNFRFITLGIFGLLAITDAFDGFIARNFNQKTDCGKWLDPIADLFFGLLPLIALSFEYRFVLLLIGALVIRQCHILYLFYGMNDENKEVKVVVTGKIKTVLVIFTIIVLMLPAGIIPNVLIMIIFWSAFASVLVSWAEYDSRCRY